MNEPIDIRDWLVINLTIALANEKARSMTMAECTDGLSAKIYTDQCELATRTFEGCQ